ncbi:MAG: bifunctional 5,10-methylene-tetrahydrofolate dehydrogenase/5,10-methylene-tetrahydrofolate cyclohydrolase [Thaumarchaeota archaeon 13_1_40CM_2_39_13_2]|nr:MAG: bifunctional 5,10-methylene-tetrahydrofolate dehydrogenase/5,10-methylene-tetrahydrofolate cyclohydrolase [Thaumarchaeota archaeon 13_1_40CM_2_39_13_2]OLE41087.1 MAG: bifunctional 5,10-methylene-tetrahydrofolate dehydrogenase/5,10-methylene-tetrahydrofolate cyclohydrolase [Thaumarchaeota archaeon 13_1_20CM_2_39_20]
MAGQRIDGTLVANSVKDIVREAVSELKKESIEPCLATILVGDDPASAIYVKNKQKACTEVGITTKDHKLPSSFSQKEMNVLIDLLNRDNSVHGILVQIPLPGQLNEFAITSRISPVKDVDCLTPFNIGLLVSNRAILKPCTPSGIIELFDYYKIDLAGKNAVIVNRSNLVGKPLYNLMLERDATVTTCHSKTRNLKEHCQRADIVITAIGDRSKFVLTADMIKDGAIVIDVGTTRLDGRLVGDVDYENVIKKASYVTPVPGGVGPMTIAMLLKNTVTAASISKGFVPDS